MARDRIKIGGPGVLYGQPGQLHVSGILHFNTGNGIDWRNIGSLYWPLYRNNMISTSNFIRYKDPDYPNYFNSYILSPVVTNFNTCANLVSGTQYGKIYLAGGNNSMRIFDPKTQSYTAPTYGSGVLTGTIQTCVLLFDKTVCNIPAPTVASTSSTITIYDPNQNKIVAKSTRIFCNTTSVPDYWSSIMLPSPQGTTPGSTAGTVFLPPYGTPYPAIYDPTADTLTQITNVAYDSSNTGVSNQFYRDCALLPSGRIFMVPYSATSAAIYNPATQQSTFLSSPPGYFGSGKYYHAVTLIDGRVFCSPYLNQSPGGRSGLIYDEGTNTFTLTTPIQASVRKSILLPDGRIFCVPFTTRDGTLGTDPYGAIYDPINDTVIYIDFTGITSSAGNPTSDFFRTAAMQFDGKIFIPAGSASSAVTFGTINYSFDWNILASAYHNAR